MRNNRIFAFLAVWFSIAVFASFFASPVTAPSVAAFFLLIAVSVLSLELLLRSGAFAYLVSGLRGRPPRGFKDNLSKMAFYVRLASRSRSYGFREVALVLREALLTEELGSGNYPPDWIATPNGDGALAKLLTRENSSDLMEILRIPEMSSEAPMARMNRAYYFSKLGRALSLIEEHGSRI